MIWNVFLAWIPLELAFFLLYLSNRKSIKSSSKIFAGLAWVLWLLFYPNSPYIITDFIHLSANNYYFSNPDYTPYSTVPRILFNDDPKIWYDLFTITIGVWIGYMSGFISLFINHRLIQKTLNRMYGWCFVVVTSLLSGFAIYLGRFIRWNSWDVILNPQNILKILFNDIHNKSLLYTLMFGSLNIILYIINYVVTTLSIEKN
jgi:uncharacterized membrane protein